MIIGETQDTTCAMVRGSHRGCAIEVNDEVAAQQYSGMKRHRLRMAAREVKE